MPVKLISHIGSYVDLCNEMQTKPTPQKQKEETLNKLPSQTDEDDLDESLVSGPVRLGIAGGRSTQSPSPMVTGTFDLTFRKSSFIKLCLLRHTRT